MLGRSLPFLSQRRKEKTDRAIEKTRSTWFGRVTSLFQRARIDDQLWDQLEELLIRADVGTAATQKLLGRVKERLRSESATQSEAVLEMLKQEMVEVLSVEHAACRPETNGQPLVLLMVGVNGGGKTTSVAKLAHLFKEEGSHVLLGAADTFRAAAIEQLRVWGQRLEVDVIAHQLGADPGAVAFDTLQAATARGADVVIIDTAGRLHTKLNLMEELKKVQRVLSRQQDGRSPCVILTLDATTGQNGLLQARSFTEALECNGVFLAKLDGTAKGAVVVPIADELKLPVLYIGTGEHLQDVAPFDPGEFVEALFASSGTR